MTDGESLDAILTQEVTTLSTKLVTAVAKLSELEEKLLQLRRENQALRTGHTALEDIKTRYEQLVPVHVKMKEEFAAADRLRQAAEAKISELENEVEDLTASLFDEANKMVSDALRETYNFKVKNGKLQEELLEKNTIIDNLQDQLRDLKQLFFRIEEQRKMDDAPSLERRTLGFVAAAAAVAASTAAATEPPTDENLLHQQQMSSLVFSPTIRSIRFDLQEYLTEFRPFIYTIVRTDFVLDITNLKTTKYFRRVWHEDLENSIPVVPTPANFINRWQKGKNFWNLLAEGKAIIEPISGVNETYKLAHGLAPLSAPIATREPCNFCGEHQDDILEHARLYSIKLMNPEYRANSTSASEQEEVLASYALCNYCLVKLRNICEFFAKIRLVHSNAYKLNPEGDAGDASVLTSPHVSQVNRFNRLSGIMGEKEGSLVHERLGRLRIVPTKREERQEEAKVMRLYLMFVQIRAKIFWSKIGFWDNASNTVDANLEDTHFDAFMLLIGSVESHAVHQEESAPTPRDEMEPRSPAASSIKDRIRQLELARIEVETIAEAEVAPAAAPETGVASSPIKVESDDDYADTTEEFEAKSGPQPPALGRKQSRSKKFNKKINSDLNDTLAMLQESMEDPDASALVDSERN